MGPLSILCVIAHPDDEISCGGCLAKYAAQGVSIDIVCAARGDGADAQIAAIGLATRETLGQVRSQELRAACQLLGAHPPLLLGYQDGEVERVPLEKASEHLARIIRQLAPLVVITHGPEGGYGHPDHIAVSRFTTRAFALASDPQPGEDFSSFSPAKLYYLATPRSVRDQVPQLRERYAEVGGQQLGFIGVDEACITTEVDIRQWLLHKAEAARCHRTQFGGSRAASPSTALAALPEAERWRLIGYERFVLAQARFGEEGFAPNVRENDLFAGLR